MSFICHKVLVLRASFLDTYLWKCPKPVFNSRFLSNDLYLGCKSSSSLPRTTTALCLCVHVIGVCESEGTTAPRQEIVWKITQQSPLTSLKKQLSSPHCEGRDLLISYPSLSKRKLLSSGVLPVLGRVREDPKIHCWNLHSQGWKPNAISLVSFPILNYFLPSWC